MSMSELTGNSLASATGRQKAVDVFFAAILFLPVFFDQTGIFNSLSLEARGLPVSLLAIVFFPIAIFACRSAPALIVLAAVIVCILLPTAVLGVVDPEHFSLTLVMSYLSSLFVGFSACSLMIRFGSSAAPERFLLTGVYVISIVASLWLPYQIGNVLSVGRANGSVLDIFVIYQVWVYWPTALAIAFCASFISSDPKLWVLRLLIFVGILFTGAREPFLLIFMFGIIFAISSGSAKYFLMITVSGAFFVASLLVFMVLYPDALISLKLSAMFSGETSLDGGRFGVLDQFDLSHVNLVWGTGFSESGIFGTPHNQFIEFYYRGGIFGLAIAAILVVAWVRSYGFCSKIVWSIFGALLVVSYLLNTPIRVPYTGAIIWALLFFLVESRGGRVKNVPVAAEFARV